MRKRTPSEVKAYGDGYIEAYRNFCHLLDRHEKETAIRKMKIFADAVALTVETATDTADTPQTDYPTEWCENCELWRDNNCKGVAECKRNIEMLKELNELYEEADTPQTDCETCKYGQDKHRYAHICNECGVGINNYTPQTDCENCREGREHDCYGCPLVKQTDCGWGEPITVSHSKEMED